MYYPEDDFDIDEGLDFDQFDYKSEVESSPPDAWDSYYHEDEARYRPDHPQDRRYQEEEEDYYETTHSRDYPRTQPYVAEIDDNVIFKSHPEYERSPNEYVRPMSTLPRDRAYRESTRFRKPSRDRYTYHDPREVDRQHPRESFRSRPAYPETIAHYEPRKREEYHSRRPRSPQYSRSEDKYSRTRDWLISGSFERKTTRKSKREKVRKFPPPEPNAPVIPPPDYDDDDTSGVLYVPNPDYR